MHFEIGACTPDGGFDLGAGANDAGIVEQAENVFLTHANDGLWIEVLKCFAEGVSLAQHDDPSQARLESLEHERFPE